MGWFLYGSQCHTVVPFSLLKAGRNSFSMMVFMLLSFFQRRVRSLVVQLKKEEILTGLSAHRFYTINDFLLKILIISNLF